MKQTVKLFVVFLLLSALFFSFSVAETYAVRAENEALTKDFVRLHIRAASDSDSDQSLKLKVRDGLLAYTTRLLDGISDGSEAREILKAHLDDMTYLCREILKKNGSTDDVSVRIDREYFEYREYDGFYLPAGDYDALIVEIGSGKGHNWWCVVFPAVCLSGVSGNVKTDTGKVPARFRLSDRAAVGPVRYESWFFNLIRRLFA